MNGVLACLALCACVAVAGCASRAWYHGFQASQRQQCYKRVSQDEIQRCLDRINGTTYDDYKKARDEARRGDR